MPAELSCCVDVPRGGALLRYGLEELLRGLGFAPEWTARDGARLLVEVDGEDRAGEGLCLRVSEFALADLDAPRQPAVGALGWTSIEGEHWPVPVGPAGETARLGDLVAAAAWWLAGLQEQAGAARDRHGRFPFAVSLQAALGDRPGGPLRPAVDAYRRRLAEALRAAGIETPGRTWGGKHWAVALTHDLDAVRTRRLRAWFGELRRGRIGEALRRSLGPDRRRASIDQLRALAKTHGAAATFFVKPGAWAPEDVPGGLEPGLVGRLRRWEGEGHEVGWHPGYGTHGRTDRLAEERERFIRAFGRTPRLARTHFLRWTEPETPRQLAASGVRVDSTLGFAEHEGFRRGTALPFRVFDAEADAPLELWEMPLAVMDTTLTQYRDLGSAGQAEALRRAFAAARASGGVAGVLWHNQIDGDDAGWEGRRRVLDRALSEALAAGARVGPLGGLLESWRAPGDAEP